MPPPALSLGSLATATVACAVVDCEPSVQVRVYVKEPGAVAICAVVPAVARLPDQGVPSAPPPPAEQAVASVEDQVSVIDCPTWRAAGETESVAVGTAGVTVRVACAVASGTVDAMLGQSIPSVYCPAVCMLTVLEPESRSCWVNQGNPGGLSPVATQRRELVDVHVTVKFCPAGIVAGLMDSVAVGAGGGWMTTVTGVEVTLPAVPLEGAQVTVRV